MNKKAYIILGGIVVLIIIVGGILFVLLSSKKAPAPTATNTAPASTSTSTSGSSGTTGTSTGTSSTGSSSSTGTSTGSSSTTGTSSTSTGTSSTTSGTATGTSSGGVVKISDSAVISPILSFQGSGVWYFTSDGTLYDLDLTTGNKQTYLLPKNIQVSSVLWPSQGSDFIAVTANTDGTKSFNYYNSTTKLFTAYPQNVREAAFLSGKGNQVLYVWQNTDGSSTLSIANPDLSDHKQLATMPDADDTLQVSPLGNAILAYDAGQPSNGKLYYMSLNDQKIHTIKTNASNAAVWSNDGQHFVFNKYTAANPNDPTLWLGSVASTTGDVSLGIQSSVSQIAFNLSGSTMYYAAPAVGSSAGSVNDSFWSYNVQTAAKTQIYNGSTAGIVASDILISNDESTLYFVNSDGYLYSVPIKQ